MKKKIPVIVGATASGKSKLAGNLFDKKFIDFIIMADSRKIYTEAEIGVSSPSGEAVKKIQYYMINIIEPYKMYSAAKYAKEVIKIFKSQKGRPVITGGSGLYIKAVFNGLFSVPEIECEIREKIVKKINTDGLEGAYIELCDIDPEAAEKIHPNDMLRISRALEVYAQTGEKISQLWKKNRVDRDFEPVYIGLEHSSSSLKKRIRKRIENMLEKGLVEEVSRLHDKYGKNIWLFSSIGYRETLLYIDGKIDYNELIEKVYVSTWHYARKQIVWFKKLKGVHWICSQGNNIKEITDKAINIWIRNGIK